jgi:hypothetical protein
MKSLSAVANKRNLWQGGEDNKVSQKKIQLAGYFFHLAGYPVYIAAYPFYKASLLKCPGSLAVWLAGSINCQALFLMYLWG